MEMCCALRLPRCTPPDDKNTFWRGDALFASSNKNTCQYRQELHASSCTNKFPLVRRPKQEHPSAWTRVARLSTLPVPLESDLARLATMHALICFFLTDGNGMNSYQDQLVVHCQRFVFHAVLPHASPRSTSSPHENLAGHLRQVRKTTPQFHHAGQIQLTSFHLHQGKTRELSLPVLLELNLNVRLCEPTKILRESGKNYASCFRLIPRAVSRLNSTRT